MIVGVNVDPRRQARPALVAELSKAGVQVARFPLVREHHWVYPEFIAACSAEGILALPVFVRESFEPNGSLEASLSYWKYLLADTAWSSCFHLQIGNEPDQESDSSWTMEPADLAHILNYARYLWPHATLIGPGLVSGNPSYWGDVMAEPDAIAVHPYGARPAEDFPASGWGTGLLDLSGYQAFNKPIWITEFGAREAEFDDLATRALYLSRMFAAFQEAGCRAAVLFSWHDYEGYGVNFPGSPGYIEAGYMLTGYDSADPAQWVNLATGLTEQEENDLGWTH